MTFNTTMNLEIIVPVMETRTNKFSKSVQIQDKAEIHRQSYPTSQIFTLFAFLSKSYV